MDSSEALSVWLSPLTRRILAEAAPTRDAAGASALARDILERWAAETLAVRTETGVERAAAFLREHPDWDEDPSDFFRENPKQF